MDTFQFDEEYYGNVCCKQGMAAARPIAGWELSR
uniref:Uncharacterized protein n=1 Tax=Arundo donax TaxID=35708 RepID=A0A0A9FGI1_ARUDO